MPNPGVESDRIQELRRLILDEVDAGLRRHGLPIPAEPEARHDARKRFLIGAIGEDENLWPDWLWAQLALMEADQTPDLELKENFQKIDGILERIRSV